MNTNGLTVRRREPSDISPLGKVLIRVHEVDAYPVEGVAQPEAWLTPPREIAAWTALLGHQPVGHISLAQADSHNDAAQVWVNATGGNYADIALPVRLFIDPDHRQSGGGQRLMVAAHNHAIMRGQRLVFDVMLKDRAAIRLYEAAGCEQLGTITHHHSDGLEEPAVVYVAPEQMQAPQA